MIQFWRIANEVDQLNVTEGFVYSILVYNAGKQITRRYIAKCLGTKDLDWISDILKRIEDKHIIKRGKKYLNQTHRLLDYELCYPTGWFKVGRDYFKSKVDGRVRGFALKLRRLAFSDTLKIEYNKKEICEKMGISKATLNRYLKALREAGVIDDKLRFTGYFIEVEANHLNRENTKLLIDVIGSATYRTRNGKIVVSSLETTNYPKKDVLKMVYFYNKKLYTLANADMLFYKMLGGMWKGR